MTEWLSMPRLLLKTPISLAKHTFMAWNALQAYLIISATRIEVCSSGALMDSYSLAAVWPLRRFAESRALE